MIYVGTVTNGVLEKDLSESIRRHIRELEGKIIRIEIKRFVRVRTDNQNRFFHGPFLDECHKIYHDAGNVELDREDVKSLLKQQFGIEKPIKQPDGEVKYIIKSTAEYNTVEIEDFMEKIRAHFAGFGYQLPYPNEEA